ncbi:adenosylcobinamide amidohydrolase [Vibrio sp.]|nr:adenosylcobinamide amidohydrolase [Vibrio sp.]
MSPVKHILHEDYLVLIPESRCRLLGSAVLNGGISEACSFLNLRVDKAAPPPWLPPQETLSIKANQLDLPQPTTAMMTAASMRSLGYSQQERQNLVVQCWVTAGLSNTRRIGDPADEKPRAGTINIWLYVNQRLMDAALAEALIMLTEGKVTAIRDADITSPISGLPASGTGTDSHIVFCPVEGEAQEYCGKHTLLGELIGLAVLSACRDSLDKCLSKIEER